jgi:YlmC/YmxH family sporulation protein
LVKVSELRLRDVINTVDGKRLGTIRDIDLDLETGKIRSLILPGVSGRLFSLFARNEEVAVPWEKIMKIGVDVILVTLESTVQPIQPKRLEREKS